MEPARAVMDDRALKYHFRCFCDSTSAHGLSQISKKSSKVREAFWLLSFLTSLVVCIWLILGTSGNYTLQRSSMMSKVKFDHSKSFPVVTICNLNPHSYSKLVRHQYSFFENLGLFDSGCERTVGNDEDLTSNLFEYNQTVTTIFGHSKRDFIVDCRYNNVSGCEVWFKLTVDPQQYNCYTFEPPVNPTYARKRFGLSLTLFVEDWMLDTLPPTPVALPMSQQEGAGVRVFLHQQGHKPQLRVPESGEVAKVGHTTDFTVDFVDTTKLSKMCNSNKTIVSGNWSCKYSRNSCVLVKLQTLVANACNCVSSYHLVDEHHSLGKPFCSGYPCNVSKNFENLQCFVDVAQKNMDVDKDCLPPCTERNYKVKTIGTTWPSDIRRLNLHGLARNKPNDTLYNEQLLKVSKDQEQKFIKENMLKINIYFDNFEITEEVEVLDMDSYALFSNIGGCLGFCVGISVLTLLEVLELILELARCLRSKFKTNKQNKSQTC